ncbi:hypothetical protein J6590_078141 [Homalodisca vitripennis]|nr:hypothetical protein J6590_078141 [Homalodisca vitripennis]
MKAPRVAECAGSSGWLRRHEALRGAAVVISLRRLHSEERSRSWDQSPQTAQRGTGRGSRQNS